MKKLTAFAALFLMLVVAPSAMAVTQDFRTYITGFVKLTDFNAKMPLSIFGKNENRFRSQGLVYDKEFIGIQQQFLPWFIFRTYWVHKDLWYTKHADKQMYVAEFIFKHRRGYFGCMYRNGNEWHITDGFYRNREKFEFHGYLPEPAKWLYFWVSEEFRIDSDEGRINMNDVWLGLGFKPRKGIDIRAFWGNEMKHRKTPGWVRTDLVGVSMTFHL